MRSNLALSTAALALVVATSACGRSGLFDVSIAGAGGAGGNGEGGDGGAATGGGGAGGSANGGGGTGGVPGWPCPLELLGPVGIAGAKNFHVGQPTFTFSSDDRTQVTVAMEWLSVEGPSPIPSELRHTTFKPWASWPEGDIAPSFLASFDRGRSFAAAPSSGDRFALLASDVFDSSPPDGIVFTTNMKPGNGAIGAFVTVRGDAHDSLFARQQGNRHLVGMGTRPVVPNQYSMMHLRTVTEQGGTLAMGSTWELGCGNKVAADALAVSGGPLGTGWLVAVSAAAFATTDCSSLPHTYPGVLSVAFVDTALGIPALRDSITEEFLYDVKLAARPGGAWLARVHKPAGSTDIVKVATLDDSGAIGTPITVIEKSSSDLRELAIAPAFGGLVVMYSIAQETHLRLVLENGAVSEPVIFHDFDPPFDILAEPNGKSVLIGGTTPVAGAVTGTQIGRLRCQ
ncbi:MAG: hypothetical protein EXR75_12710 [Myxococcales bacterium]|nr:hypothetical protein [Myxococcales bacterium]